MWTSDSWEKADVQEHDMPCRLGIWKNRAGCFKNESTGGGCTKSCHGKVYCSPHHVEAEEEGEMETYLYTRELPSHFTSNSVDLLLNMLSYMLNRNDMHIKVKRL